MAKTSNAELVTDKRISDAEILISSLIDEQESGNGDVTVIIVNEP